MRLHHALIAALGLLALAVMGNLAYQNTLVPIALADSRELYMPGKPEFSEDAARLEALLPAGPGAEAFLATQSDLTLIEQSPGGAWVGQLISGLQATRHGRRWRITLRSDWPMQDGAVLDAGRAAAALAPEARRLGGEVRVIDSAILEFRFSTRVGDPLEHLSRWRVPGTGPFLRQGNTLIRFDGFRYGKAGIAALTVVTDPAFLESRSWADGLAAARWAWAAFPGKVQPEDMARVRMAPYDQFRMKDGSVWFLSRRMRRLRPNLEDWTRTRVFGAWNGSMDLPYDPLGL
jgi:hypothetical protein